MNRLTDLVNELKTYFLTRDAWRTFTPVLYQNGAIANTVTQAKYVVIANTVIASVFLTANAAGSTGGGDDNIYILLPEAITPNHGLSSLYPLGEGIYNDGGTVYSCSVTYTGTISGQPGFAFKVVSTTSGNVLGTDPAIAVAANDQAAFTISYERS